MNLTVNPADAIHLAHERGWFWDPAYPDGQDVHWADIDKLRFDDDVVQDAFRSGSRMQATDYVPAVMAAHRRLPDWDGVLGPAMIEMLGVERCAVPDFAPPKGAKFAFDDPDLQAVCERMRDDTAQAIGSGNWKSCHNVGQYHSAAVRVARSGIRGFLSPVFTQVLKNVRASYAKMGLLWRFVENGKDIVTGESFDGRYNIEFSFVSRSSGWIGLAIIGQNQGCSGSIWCRYLASYQPSDVVREWTTLIKHELGHNTGRNHTGGGVMNPSIVRGLPTDWQANDPSYNWLRSQFGGVPVPVDNSPPPPDKPKIDARFDSLEADVEGLRVKQVVTDAALQFLIAERNK